MLVLLSSCVIVGIDKLATKQVAETSVYRNKRRYKPEDRPLPGRRLLIYRSF